MNVHSVWSGWTCVAACGRRSDVGCSVVGEIEGEKERKRVLTPNNGKGLTTESQPAKSPPSGVFRFGEGEAGRAVFA